MIDDDQGHEIVVSPKPADIDFMGHVNNSVYLRWVQDVVLGHWRSRAPPDLVNEYAWIAVEHHIFYRAAAYVDQTLSVSTALRRVKGLRAFYETLILRNSVVIAEVKSVWASVDPVSKKLKRISAADTNRILPKFARTWPPGP